MGESPFLIAAHRPATLSNTLLVPPHPQIRRPFSRAINPSFSSPLLPLPAAKPSLSVRKKSFSFWGCYLVSTLVNCIFRAPPPAPCAALWLSVHSFAVPLNSVSSSPSRRSLTDHQLCSTSSISQLQCLPKTRHASLAMSFARTPRPSCLLLIPRSRRCSLPRPGCTRPST